VGDAKALLTDARKECATNFGGQGFGCEYARFFTREILYKLSGNVGLWKATGAVFEECLRNQPVERRTGRRTESRVWTSSFIAALMPLRNCSPGDEASICKIPCELNFAILRGEERSGKRACTEAMQISRACLWLAGPTPEGSICVSADLTSRSQWRNEAAGWRTSSLSTQTTRLWPYRVQEANFQFPIKRLAEFEFFPGE